MKIPFCRYLIFFTLLFCLFAQGAWAAPLTPSDKDQLLWLFGSFESYVNQGDLQGIFSLFSPNMTQERRDAITNEIYKKVAGGIRLEFYPDLSDESIKEIKPDNLYEVSGIFKAEGPNWNLSGLKATFTVEKVGYYFLIYDTTIFEKMGFEGVGKILSVVFGVIGLIFLIGIGVVVLVIVLIVRSQKKKKTVGTGEGPGAV